MATQKNQPKEIEERFSKRGVSWEAWTRFGYEISAEAID